MKWWDILKTEDYPVKPDGPFSEKEMKKRWDKDNPNDPHIWRKDQGKPSWTINNMQWFLLYVNNKAAVKSGFIDHGEFYLLLGAYSPYYKGTLRYLVDYREKHMDKNKIKIAGFAAKKGSSLKWIQKAKERGFEIPPTDTSGISEKWLKRLNGRYAGGNRQWGIRRETTPVSKPREITQEEVTAADKKRKGKE
jgi:hypothetical protein